MVNNILFNDVSFTYNANSPFEFKAIEHVNFEIPANKITAIIGHTGSGKSTVLQHLNVLVRPTAGSVTIADEIFTATSKHKSLRAIRKKVGVVFQFPEAQLFEETVLKDVMFGPRNFGVSEQEAQSIAREKLSLVGIDEALFERSPFDLSGGQMRRVAIAGVLASSPEILVLDEPTAGLDPKGHQDMLAMFAQLQKEQSLTMVMVTHQMDDVIKYADHVIVMHQGTAIKEGTPQEIFSDETFLTQYQLGLAKTMAFAKLIEGKTGVVFDQAPLTVDSLVDQLVALKKAGDAHVR